MATRAGEINVRWSMENAELVRQALLAFGRDGERALRQFDASAKPIPKSLNVVSDSINEAKIAAAGWASQLGPVGRILTSIGPAGLIAGAGIGAAVLGMAHLISKTNELAEKAGRWNDFGQSIGLSVEKVQALTIAGAEVGVTSEKIETGLGRMSAAMEEFRRGTGNAYEQVNRINPALADQLTRVRDTTQFIDLLAKAWERADLAQRNALSRAMFGRGGLDLGRLLGEINGAGGLAGLENKLKGSIVLTGEQAKKFDELKDATDRLRTSALDRIIAIQAPFQLQAQKETAEFLDSISKSLKEISQADIKQSVIDFVSAGLTAPFRAGRAIGQRIAGVDSFDARFGPNQAAGGIDEGTRASRLGGLPVPLGPKSPEALYNEEKRRLALLGSAITPTEQLRLKELELNAAVAAGTTTRAIANRAYAAEVQAKAQVAVQARAAIGVVSEQEQVEAGLARLRDQRARGYIKNAEEMALAERLMRREAKESADALEVRRSTTPNLVRLRQEGEDLTKLMDSEFSSALRSSTTDLLNMAKGTDTLSAGFAKLAQRMADSLAQALLMKTVVAPLAGLISNGLGGLGGLGGGGAGLAATGGINPGFAIGGAANGAAFHHGVIPFALGGVVSRPSWFQFAGGGAFHMGVMSEKDPEAIMPLRRLPSGRLGIESTGGGGMHVSVGGTSIVVQGNADASTVTAMRQELAKRDRDLPAKIAKTIRALKSDRVL
jgi:hypothetical protein